MLLIYNSSQCFESELIESWNKSHTSENNRFISPYSHDSTSKDDLRISYSEDFHIFKKHMELYNILWEEICKHFP